MTIRTESALTLQFFGRVSRPSDVETVGFSLLITVFPAVLLSVAISGRTLSIELKQTSLGDLSSSQEDYGSMVA